MSAQTSQEETVGDSASAANEPRLRSGTTYARIHDLPLPPRSTDWAFVWRCRELRHEHSRIALVLKATPFFSLEPTTRSARARLLTAFPNVALVNLSQLRTSRLFQEYEDDDAPGRRKKRAAGPALLFFSNCLAANEQSVTIINLPWTPSFQRTGVFELPAEPPKSLPLASLMYAPALLKTSFFGTERDVWFLERLARNDKLIKLGDWLREQEIPAGQGYQVGSKMPSGHLRGLPAVTAADLVSLRLPFDLPKFSAERVHRARDPEIYRGPLVLLPEGKLSMAAAPGRYPAVFDSRDLAFNESFMGVSFHSKSAKLGLAFAAIMQSSLIAHQIAFTGGTVGVKQTKIELTDLDQIRIPRLDRLSDPAVEQLASIAEALASAIRSSDVAVTLSNLDALVAELVDLGAADCALLADTERRARAILFETPNARRPMEAPPTAVEISEYASNLCGAFNAFASEDDDLILVPDRYGSLEGDLLVMRFRLAPRAGASRPDLRPATLVELGDAPFAQLGGSDLPYLKPAKSLRLYAEDIVYLLKPAHYKLFSPAAGQSDGDRIVADLMDPSITEPKVLS